jgi:hypothetical protein
MTFTKLWEDTLTASDTPLPYPDFEWHKSSPHGDETEEVPIALHTGRSLNTPVEQTIFTVACPVNDHEEFVVLDSAANVSLVRTDWMKEKKLSQHLKKVKKKIYIRGINGKPQEPRGVLTLSLGTDQDKTPFDFYVFDELPVPILIGLDILDPLHVVLDVASRSALIGRWGRVLTASMSKRDDIITPTSEVLYLGADYIIPPRSEQKVKIRVHKDSKYKTRRAWGWYSPHDDLAAVKGMEAGRAVGDCHEGQAYAVLVNHSKTPTKLSAGRPLMQFTPLDKEEYHIHEVNWDEGKENKAKEKKDKAKKDNIPTPTYTEEEKKERELFLLKLKKELNMDRTFITPEQQTILITLLLKNRQLFEKDDTQPSVTPFMAARIRTGDATPIRSHPYRRSPAEGKEIKRQVNKMVKAGVVQPSCSPWAAPVVLVPKKDGVMRFAIDYRKLNEVTIRDNFPLPNINSIFDSLGGKKYFSQLDCVSAFHAIPMDVRDRKKTAFITRDGLYEFRRMPFGLKNAPAIFSRLMEMVMSGMTWKQCLVYWMTYWYLVTPTKNT